MSSTSSSALSSSVVLTELPPSRYPLMIWALASVLAGAAIIHADLTLLWVLLAGGASLLAAVIEWRRQVRVEALWWDAERLICQCSGGSLQDAEWPLPVVIAPWWISLGFPGGWRRRWITLYRDQLDADAFRRLRVAARHA
jgi:hypothetical protein